MACFNRSISVRFMAAYPDKILRLIA